METMKMKTLDELRSILASGKTGLKGKYKIKKLGIFGSYARGTAEPGSDVDLLVELVEPIGLDFVSLVGRTTTDHRPTCRFSFHRCH